MSYCATDGRRTCKRLYEVPLSLWEHHQCRSHTALGCEVSFTMWKWGSTRLESLGSYFRTFMCCETDTGLNEYLSREHWISNAVH